MSDVLPSLLARIRDGVATNADRLRARALVEADDTLPDDVRTVALTVPEEATEDAGALLALLGLEPLELPGSPSGKPSFRNGDAFAVEADVADDVMAALGLERSLPIAEAVASEAGTIDVAGRVMAELGAAIHPIRDAASAPRRDAASAPRRGAASAPRPVALPVPLPFVANNARGFRWAAVALAAAALFALILGRGERSAEETEPLVFAQAGDVVVEDLTYAEGVQVVQLEGADGAVILWVDDGEV